MIRMPYVSWHTYHTYVVLYGIRGGRQVPKMGGVDPRDRASRAVFETGLPGLLDKIWI